VKKALIYVSMLAAAIAVASVSAFAGAVVTPPSHVPEPATLALLATGMGAVALVRKLRK
jgi:predicted enzyme related to lactoylglutathione lyase